MSNISSKQLQDTRLDPPQPVYILRGHGSTIQALTFTRDNSRLISGDADGWIVLWSLSQKRPAAVWKAHEASVLGIEPWGTGKIITHGRDGRLCVWQLSEHDEADMSRQLPVEDATTHRKHPWLLHTIPVSSLTFCSFATCIPPPSVPNAGQDHSIPAADNDTLLLAFCGASDSDIQIHHLPSETQVALIPAPDQANGKTGMVMALHITYTQDASLLVIAGYESGRTYVYRQVREARSWEPVYTCRPHDQPILSLDVDPSLGFYYTSGADAVLAKHALGEFGTGKEAVKVVQTKHAGQQGLKIRSDGKILVTAGWDARARVYSCKTLKELAVLKWHRDGCYAVALADVGVAVGDGTSAAVGTISDAVRPGRLLAAQIRELKVQSTHWIAVGSKDGKISLWDIY